MLNIGIHQLIGHGHFFSDTILNADKFVRYCKDRDLDVSLEKLERLERMGIFLPLLRLRRPKVKRKIRALRYEEGYEELELLKEGETWSGEVKDEYNFPVRWDEETVQSLMEEGLLWMPTKDHFQEWDGYKDADGDWEIASYYSIFQTLPLQEILAATTLRLSFDTIVDWTKEDLTRWVENVKPRAEKKIQRFREHESKFETTAKICQALSSRYLPYAKSDGATITIPHPDSFDWGKYRREWDADAFLKEVGLSVDWIVDFWRAAIGQARNIDPLDGWQDIVGFFKQNHKDHLKGNALLAQNFHLMAKLLNLFNKDITGEQHYEFDKSPTDKEAFYGKDTLNNDLRFLEYLTNQYGINPRPKLILVVEGDGEEHQFPRLAEKLLQPSFPTLRIAVVNMKGVGNFKDLKRFIDYYHSLQTIVFVVLDNEGGAEAVKEKLCTKSSLWYQRATISIKDYFHLWEKNVEFDNFTDEEISEGMTKACETRYCFSKGEIAICRQHFNGKGESNGDPLSNLYKEKLSRGLTKPDLLKILFDYAIANPEMEINGNKNKRPIIEVILKVQRLALNNHQPSNFDTWQKTQNSSWLRNPKP
jgi:hypothetical protein